jgi:hypothetical protein
MAVADHGLRVAVVRSDPITSAVPEGADRREFNRPNGLSGSDWSRHAEGVKPQLNEDECVGVPHRERLPVIRPPDP